MTVTEQHGNVEFSGNDQRKLVSGDTISDSFDCGIVVDDASSSQFSSHQCSVEKY